MSRQRTAQIQESLEFLESLEKHYRDEPQEARIKMLRLLKEDPARTLEQAAKMTGCSERSVYRWWSTYQAKGLQGLLAPRRNTTAATPRIGRNEAEELREMLQTGKLSTLHDVQAWLDKRFGLKYSVKGVANLLQRRLKARRVWIVSEGNEIRVAPNKQPEAKEESPIIPDKVLQFLNRLPLISDTQKAVEAYKAALMDLLGEVDRVSIYININCDLHDPRAYHPGIFVTVDTSAAEESISVTSHQEGTRPSDRFLENMRQQGVPLELNHQPVVFDYYYNDLAYLGTIFLWRDRTKPQISKRVQDTMKLLEPFVIYMLSDLISRHHYANPIDRLFQDALKTMSEEAGLSLQERRVVTLRLLGHAYKEIADKLSITEDAIKKHLGSVHRKTGTRSYTELFAKYFTPRLNLSHN